MRAGGSQGLRVTPPPPLPPPPFTSSAKVTAPRLPLRACCGQALSAGGERSSEAGQPHHTRAAQATATLAAVHRRPRQPPLAPAPPGRLAGSLLRFSSRGLGPVERARESRRPAPCARLGGGRRRQSRGTGTPEGAGSDGLGSAAATPLGVPGLRPRGPSGAQALFPALASPRSCAPPAPP